MSGQERLLDLLTSRATEGLSAERSRELDAGLHELAGIGADDLDLAAAAADLACRSVAADDEPMPEHLKRRILKTARLHRVSSRRSLLIESASDVIQAAWAQPEIEAYARVRGDVVWSNQRQAGFMRLSGLPVNRPEVEQYQLWIVDPSRDERPIDGGVFDIPAGVDEVIVPIDAKLRADNPTAFAITLERPGGVVVSDGPLLVVAPVGV